MRFGLKLQAGFRIGGNAPLSFLSIDTAYQADPIRSTGLPLGQGDQHDGAESNQGYIAAQPEPRDGNIRDDPVSFNLGTHRSVKVPVRF